MNVNEKSQGTKKCEGDRPMKVTNLPRLSRMEVK